MPFIVFLLVVRSQINSALANLKYMILNPSTTWNKLCNLEQGGRKLIHTGSKLIGQNVDYLKKLGPVSESTIEELISILKFKELNPDRWNRIPLRGSHYEDIFNKINSNDLSNFQGAYTLGSIYRFYVKKT